MLFTQYDRVTKSGKMGSALLGWVSNTQEDIRNTYKIVVGKRPHGTATRRNVDNI